MMIPDEGDRVVGRDAEGVVHMGLGLFGAAHGDFRLPIHACAAPRFRLSASARSSSPIAREARLVWIWTNPNQRCAQ